MRLLAGELRSVAPKGTLTAGPTAWELTLDKPGRKTFEVRVAETGRYALFTQHLPEEFRLTFTTTAGVELTASATKEYAASHTHDDTVTSVGIRAEGAVDGDKLNGWLGPLLREQGTDISRFGDERVSVQAESPRVVCGQHTAGDGRRCGDAHMGLPGQGTGWNVSRR